MVNYHLKDIQEQLTQAITRMILDTSLTWNNKKMPWIMVNPRHKKCTNPLNSIHYKKVIIYSFKLPCCFIERRIRS